MNGVEGTKMVIGTRGSDLALAQARMVEAALIGSGMSPDRIEIRIIRTIGDKRPDLKLSEFSRGKNPVVDKGIFTRELEEALLRGDIDMAVHSLKDVPTELASGFQISATLPRAPVEDVIVSKQPGWFDEMTRSDRKGTVATSSVRRARQLRWLHPELEVIDIRGNVPTRVRKLVENEDWDAIMLARAGLERLGLIDDDGQIEIDDVRVFGRTLDPRKFIPAAGQGAVAIESLKANAAANSVVSKINHAPTFERISAERTFLARLQAGCQTPVGTFTWFEDDKRVLAMKVRVFEEDNPETDPRQAEGRAPLGEPEKLADEIFEKIDGQQT